MVALWVISLYQKRGINECRGANMDLDDGKWKDIGARMEAKMEHFDKDAQKACRDCWKTGLGTASLRGAMYEALKSVNRTAKPEYRFIVGGSSGLTSEQEKHVTEFEGTVGPLLEAAVASHDDVLRVFTPHGKTGKAQFDSSADAANSLTARWAKDLRALIRNGELKV
jgi:hypothetical protein